MITLILASETERETVVAPDVLHIIRDEQSPPEADLWIMYCGLIVRAFDDGSLDPCIDFYGEREGNKATCTKCRAAWEAETTKPDTTGSAI